MFWIADKYLCWILYGVLAALTTQTCPLGSHLLNRVNTPLRLDHFLSQLASYFHRIENHFCPPQIWCSIGIQTNILHDEAPIVNHIYTAKSMQGILQKQL